MTAFPLPPSRPMTAAEFAALPEDTSARYELMEGNVVMSPRPLFAHQQSTFRLARQLDDQLPAGLVLAPEIDLDLQLAAPGRPGFVRAPDVVVATDAGRARIAAGGILRASEVVLVVEIICPGSRRTDRVIKRAEYAEAGIPHYWIVDIEGAEVELTTCRLDGSVYGGDVTYRGRAEIAEPFPVMLDLAAFLA